MRQTWVAIIQKTDSASFPGGDDGRSDAAADRDPARGGQTGLEFARRAFWPGLGAGCLVIIFRRAVRSASGDLPLAGRRMTTNVDAKDQWSLPAQHFCLQPAAKHTVGPGRGHAVSKTPSKAVNPQNIIMACKMRSATEDVCCTSRGNYRPHVWPGVIGFLAGAVTPRAFTDFGDGTNYRNRWAAPFPVKS